jgi:vancomycin permeability regulator SanA
MEVNKYLVVVTKATVIGQIYHRKIFQVQKVDFICLNTTEASKDKAYIEGMREILESKNMYFSDEYDLTNSLQSFIGSNCSMRNKRL